MQLYFSCRLLFMNRIALPMFDFWRNLYKWYTVLLAWLYLFGRRNWWSLFSHYNLDLRNLLSYPHFLKFVLLWLFPSTQYVYGCSKQVVVLLLHWSGFLILMRCSIPEGFIQSGAVFPSWLAHIHLDHGGRWGSGLILSSMAKGNNGSLWYVQPPLENMHHTGVFCCALQLLISLWVSSNLLPSYVII